MGRKKGEAIDLKTRKSWESVCLNVLGQKKYNQTRNLGVNHMGIKIEPYIPYGRKVDADA